MVDFNKLRQWHRGRGVDPAASVIPVAHQQQDLLQTNSGAEDEKYEESTLESLKETEVPRHKYAEKEIDKSKEFYEDYQEKALNADEERVKQAHFQRKWIFIFALSASALVFILSTLLVGLSLDIWLENGFYCVCSLRFR